MQRFISYMKVSVEEVLAWQPGSGLFHAMVHGGGDALSPSTSFQRSSLSVAVLLPWILLRTHFAYLFSDVS